MIYDLPKSVEIQGKEYSIRYDYRAVLDIFMALNDPDLSLNAKTLVALEIFYPEFSEIPRSHIKEAIEKCHEFINGGEKDQNSKAPKLVDWEQDFKYIAAPVNRVLGYDVRDSEKETHWWTFISAYYEIGECLFSQIVRIRDMKARGKPLSKSDKEWLRKNRHLVEFKTKLTTAEEEILAQWTSV